MNTSTSRGFTLIELLVAISLLGILGVISWRGLSEVITQRTQIAQDSARIERLVRTMAQFDRDIEQRVARVLRPPAARTANARAGSASGALEIHRDASGNTRITLLRRRPAEPGAMRVSYVLDGGKLRRTVDMPQTPSQEVLLLNDVAVFQLRRYVKGRWLDSSASDAPPATAPTTALELVIERPSGERYTKVVPL